MMADDDSATHTPKTPDYSRADTLKQALNIKTLTITEKNKESLGGAKKFVKTWIKKGMAAGSSQAHMHNKAIKEAQD